MGRMPLASYYMRSPEIGSIGKSQTYVQKAQKYPIDGTPCELPEEKLKIIEVAILWNLIGFISIERFYSHIVET